MNATLLLLATLPGSYDLDARAALALAQAPVAQAPALCPCGPGCQCPPGVCPACPTRTPAPVVLPPIRRVFQPAPVYQPIMPAMPAPFMGGFGGFGGFAPAGGC